MRKVAPAVINGGTGAEFWLLGWKLAQRYRFRAPPPELALAGAVLAGYVLAAWTRAA